MFRAIMRMLLLVAAAGAVTATESVGAPLIATIHRQDVDVAQYPWTAIGKLYNETGASCSGVLISRYQILTAAHCLYNYRTRRFIDAASLHFLVAYRIGRYAAHARIAHYEIGPGFDPERYDQTSNADWAVLTVTEALPAHIEPLLLQSGKSPAGTKAMLAGYPQDRAFALTADQDCELRERTGGDRLLLHTCRGVLGTSGAPLLVKGADNQYHIVGIQVARAKKGQDDVMIAVPAHAIQPRGSGESTVTDRLAFIAGRVDVDAFSLERLGLRGGISY